MTGLVPGTALGAVYRPDEEMVPTVELPPWTPPTLQVTAELKLPVPVTVAEHCEVAPVCTEVGVHDAATDVMVGAGGVSVMVADPDFELSVTLVAVKVTVAVEEIDAGAV